MYMKMQREIVYNLCIVTNFYLLDISFDNPGLGEQFWTFKITCPFKEYNAGTPKTLIQTFPTP